MLQDWDGFAGEAGLPSITFSEGAVLTPAPNDWFVAANGKNDFDAFQPQYYNVPTELGDVIVRASDDEPYDQWWEFFYFVGYNGASDSGSGYEIGGESTGSVEPPIQSLGPDLSIYNCAMLALKEQEIRSSLDGLRAGVIASLNVTEWGLGDEVYNEIFARFQELENQGFYDPQNPLANAARVAGQQYNATDLISLSVRGMGINVTITGVQLNFIQSTFAMQQNLERIDAEQARRGGCGS